MNRRELFAALMGIAAAPLAFAKPENAFEGWTVLEDVQDEPLYAPLSGWKFYDSEGRPTVWSEEGTGAIPIEALYRASAALGAELAKGAIVRGPLRWGSDADFEESIRRWRVRFRLVWPATDFNAKPYLTDPNTQWFIDMSPEEDAAIPRFYHRGPYPI